MSTVSETRILELFAQIPDGRYAACLDEDLDDYRFFRFATRKSGQYKGSRTIQIQSADSWLMIGYVNRIGLNQFVRLRREIEHFKMVLCTPKESAYLYAEKLGECCRCGISLTDMRSRALKIGPDCEKEWPEFLSYAISRLPDGPQPWERPSESSSLPLHITIPTSTLTRPPSRLGKLL